MIILVINMERKQRSIFKRTFPYANIHQFYKKADENAKVKEVLQEWLLYRQTQ